MWSSDGRVSPGARQWRYHQSLGEREEGDLVLEPKKMKWVFKHAERTGAERLVMLMPAEWSQEKSESRTFRLGRERYRIQGL